MESQIQTRISSLFCEAIRIHHHLGIILMIWLFYFAGNESPAVSISGQEMDGQETLPNEISAPYEVPQFPIEQIEKKLQIQRHLNVKWVNHLCFCFCFAFIYLLKTERRKTRIENG